MLASCCLCMGLVGCAGTTPEPIAPPPATSAEPSAQPTPAAASEPREDAPAAEESEEAVAGLPTRCAEGTSGDLCLPPGYLAKGLCNGDYPTVALAMFAKGTPWTRAYSVTRAVAWNASGGASSNERMAMYEELLVLRRRAAATGGIEVSGAGTSYDVLRWDGSCVTLQEGELAFQQPPQIASARVIFRRLEAHVRDALKDVEDLRPTYLAHRRECKGVTMGTVSKECERLDGELSRAIARYVRDVGNLPVPKKVPVR